MGSKTYLLKLFHVKQCVKYRPTFYTSTFKRAINQQQEVSLSSN